MKEINTVLALLLAFFTCNASQKDYQKTKPNIIYILADDLGYGDLSCYGQKHYQTPNIDKLAAQGMLFTQHYAGSTVCAPSRSSLMTGQSTGHTPIRGNKEWKPEGQWPMTDTAFTVAEMLKEAGYATGCFGKWGLGYPGSEGDPNKQGFEEFYGYNCQRMAHNYYPGHLWHNQEKVILEGNKENQYIEYAPEIIQQHALQFIEKNKDQPFFLYYPTTIPHAELLVPEKYISEYRGKYLPEMNYDGSSFGDEDFRIGGYGSQTESHAAFAAMVTLLDKQVGELLDKLKDLGLDENTLVIFSSDNGPHLEGGADPDYFDSNGFLRGYKRDLFEGGIRVPMIARWAGKIEAGSKTNHISSFWDVLPTCAEITGVKKPENIEGISFLPTLLGETEQQNHEYLYWEFHEKGGRQAIRKGKWKYVSYNVLIEEKKTIELYDLSKDIGEKQNVAEQNPLVVSEMKKILEGVRTPSFDFPFIESK